MSFGVRFGQLVKRYRDAQGLSSKELAAEALGDEAKRSRISEIENGRVAKPHAKTIDALRDYLTIPQEEVDACYKTPTTPPPQPIPENAKVGVDLPKVLLENLALRFGHDNPDAPAAELSAYLKQKATDFKELEKRLKQLTQQDERLSNIAAAIAAAMEAGDFDKADDLLADAEDIQLEHKTLVEVRKQAKLRTERAQIALFKGDADKAAKFFTQAANFFSPFDTDEDVQALRVASSALYEHGLRYGRTGLSRAIDLKRAEIAHDHASTDPLKVAAAQNELAVFLQNQATRVGGKEGEKLFEQATISYKKALTIYAKFADLFEWAMTQNNLGTAYSDESTQLAGKLKVNLLAKAITAYQESLAVLNNTSRPEEWAMTQNNLAIAFANQAEEVDGKLRVELIDKAINAFQSTLPIHTKNEHPVSWARTKNNLGNSFSYHSKQAAETKEVIKLLQQAIMAYKEALTIFTKVDYPVNWAMILHNLANTLFEQAKHVKSRAGKGLLEQAMVAFQEALTVRTKVDQPMKWAMTQECLGLAFETEAVLADKTAQNSWQKALIHFDNSLEIFDPVHMPYHHGIVTKSRARVAKKLAALD